MGYEVKLFVVSEHEKSVLAKEEETTAWAEVLAMFDVCKVGFRNTIFKEDANGFIFDIDGNTKITEDRYGDKLKVEEPEAVIEELRWVGEKYDYWRASCAADMIESIVKRCNTRDNIKIYSFGY